MGIPEEDRPVYCLCDWEDVTTFEDPVPMIERTGTDPECPIHVDVVDRGDPS